MLYELEIELNQRVETTAKLQFTNILVCIVIVSLTIVGLRCQRTQNQRMKKDFAPTTAAQTFKHRLSPISQLSNKSLTYCLPCQRPCGPLRIKGDIKQDVVFVRKLLTFYQNHTSGLPRSSLIKIRKHINSLIYLYFSGNQETKRRILLIIRKNLSLFLPKLLFNITAARKNKSLLNKQTSPQVIPRNRSYSSSPLEERYLFLVQAIGSVVIPQLLFFSKSKKWQLRYGAIRSLAIFPEESEKITPSLIQRFYTPNLKTETVLYKSIACMGKKAIPYLVRIVRYQKGRSDRNRRLSASAYNVLELMGPQILPDLLELHRSHNWHWHFGLLEMYSRFKKKSFSALPFVRTALKHHFWQMRLKAALAIAEIKPDQQTAKELLTLLQKEKNQKVKRYIIIALRTIGEAAKPAIPKLLRVVKNTRDAFLLYTLFEAILKIGIPSSHAKEAIEVFQSIIQNRFVIRGSEMAKKRLKNRAVMSLGLCGKQALPYIKNLFFYNYKYKWQALSAINEIGEVATPILRKAIQNTKLKRRKDALYIIHTLKWKPISLVPLIKRIARNQPKNSTIQEYSMLALERIRMDSDVYMILYKNARSDVHFLRFRAITLLGKQNTITSVSWLLKLYTYGHKNDKLLILQKLELSKKYKNVIVPFLRKELRKASVTHRKQLRKTIQILSEE